MSSKIGGYVDLNRLTTSSLSSEPSRDDWKRRKRRKEKEQNERSFSRFLFYFFSFFMVLVVGTILYLLFFSPEINITVRNQDKHFHKPDPTIPFRDLPYIHISTEVSNALKSNTPIVALESTIITHGMPWKENYETAKEVEDIVRLNGAVPATIAVINGVLHFGLSQTSLKELSQFPNAKKCGRRDLSIAISSKSTCGTTVSATMHLAQKAGLPIFVTGGTGGVHRGVEETWDVSADLTELGRTPVMVISAGVKSILDIPKTLERLETEEVTVVGYETNDFPAFYTTKSGQAVPHRVDSAREAAHLLHAHRTFGMDNGILLAVPVPKDYELGEGVMKSAVDLANTEAEQMNIRGKDVTPFLLKRVNELTQGRSLESNIALIKNNARVGALVAVEYNSIQKSSVLVTKDGEDVVLKKSTEQRRRIKKKERTPRKYEDEILYEEEEDRTNRRLLLPPQHQEESSMGEGRIITAADFEEEEEELYYLGETPTTPTYSEESHRIAVIGGSAVDIGSRKKIQDEDDNISWASKTSEIGTTKVSMGGVGRNVAEVLARSGIPPLLLTAIGDDSWGDLIMNNLRTLGIDTSYINVVEGKPTSTFHQILDGEGDLLVGIGDMSILEEKESIQPSKIEDEIISIKHVFFDANIPVETMRYLCELTRENRDLILYHDPVSVEKSKRVVESGCLDTARRIIIKPNEQELMSIAKHVHLLYHDNYREEDVDVLLQDSEDAVDFILDDFPQVLILLSKGDRGVSRCSFTGGSNCVHYDVMEFDFSIKTTTGAGDSFMGGYMAGRILGLTDNQSIKSGMKASVLTLESEEAVSDKICRKSLFPPFVSKL